jgi:hypothetical protein
MTTNPPPDARNARIHVATANVAVMDSLSGREQSVPYTSRWLLSPPIPEWVRLTDFETTTPRAVEELAWQRNPAR